MDSRLLDRSRRGDAEEHIAGGLRDVVNPSDDVVILGGGWGISTVTAARLTESVTVYEAAEEQIATLRDTLQLNEAALQSWPEIQHAVVGEDVNVWKCS